MNINAAERIYKALANRRRLAIIKALSSRGKLKVSDIAEGIDLSFKATSKHLQILKNAGFVESRQVSLEQYYELVTPLHPIMKNTLSVL